MMSSPFLCPWEDEWTPSKCQTSPQNQGASTEDSTTIKPPQVRTGPSLQTEESCSSSGKARVTPQSMSYEHGGLSGETKTSSTEGSLSVQELMVRSPSHSSETSNQAAWQNDSIGHTVSADESMFLSDISTASETAPSSSITCIADERNGTDKNTLAKSLDGSKTRSILQDQTFRTSLRIMQKNETENNYISNEYRSNKGERHIQLLSTSDTTPNQERHHDADKPYKCNICAKTFSKCCYFRSHELAHTRSQCFKCTLCGYTFSSSSSIRQHERIHMGSKPFKCTFCEKAFTHSSNLHVHERIHTGSRPFNCTFCKKAFSHISGLKAHEQIHTRSKPYGCLFCEKAFTVSSSLHVHERTHTGSKPFKCSLCGYASTCSSHLRLHERIHTGSKPFKCTFCEKAFTHSSNLHQHVRIHTGSKPFKCTFCEKVFSQSGNLHKHERIHTGSKSLTCASCGKAFTHSSSLHRHEKIHT